MISRIKYIPIIFIGLILLIGIVSAVPVTGAAGDITSNNFNISVATATITGNDVWVIYGQASGKENWISSNYTKSGVNTIVQVWGAPILGNTLYYAEACDQTGCGNEISLTTLEIPLLTVTDYGAGFRNLTQSHYNIMNVAPAFLLGYFNIMPASVFFGLLFGLIVVGMWRRNRGIRLVSVVMIILSPLIMSSNAGLFFGIPLAEQALGQALLAAGIAGILLSFVKR
jgi:hypothetical protein